MIGRRVALLAMLLIGVGTLQPRTALAATVTDCPTSEGALSADISNAGSGGTVSLVCSTATTIPFTSPITISSNLILDASHSPGAVTIDGGGTAGLFATNESITFGLAGLTLAHAANSAISNLGNLIVARSRFYANSGDWGGAIATLPISGAPSVTVIDSTFAGNSAGRGGAIYVSGSPLTITGSTFSGNSAIATPSSGEADGGAIYSNYGPITISNSTFYRNTAFSGGAIVDAVSDFGTGGALTIIDSTFSGNTAANTNPLLGAGAIVHAGGGTATIGGTIIAHSIGGNCVGMAPPLTDLGYNLTDAGGNCGLTGPTDLPNTDPRLDPAGLQTNGGPTQTIALLSNSPAIDAGPATCTPATDQRGVSRPQGRACDIGAYESPFTQLITNVGFEHGVTGWGISSLNPFHAPAPISPHSGSHVATLCNYSPCLDALWQTVTVPTAFRQATMSVWLNARSQESVGSCSDRFYLLFLTPTGSVIPPAQGTCSLNTNGWVHVSFDATSYLRPYTGQQATVLFLGTGNTTLPSSFSLDDVSLVTTPETATTALSTTQPGPLHPVTAPACVPNPHNHHICTPG